MSLRWSATPILGCLAVVVVTACDGGAVAAAPPGSTTTGPPAVELTLTAKAVEFQPAELTVPAGRDLVITFDNADSGIPHGLVLYADQAHTITLGTAPVVVGPDHQVFHIAGLRRVAISSAAWSTR